MYWGRNNNFFLMSIFLSGAVLNACLPPLPAPKPARQNPINSHQSPAAVRYRETKQVEKKPQQSHTEAWALICHAEQKSGADQQHDRAQRGAMVAEWITANVKNDQARAFWIRFGRVEPKDKPKVFSAEAAKAGQSSCPLHELLFSQAKMP